ncbi:MAG TPA: hypothetical protein VI386_22180 [Candidatus Sulfotelmatobacter sp.]
MQIPNLRVLRILAILMVVASVSAVVAAQDDANATPLGDVARNLRKKVPAQQVIDNDNLSTVVEQVQIHRLVGSAVQYSIDGGGKTFQISSPDANCRLSFNANSKALLSNQYTQMQLPAHELAKLEGPAVMDGSSLQVAVFNGTNWHVSEVAIAVTVVKRDETKDGSAAKVSERLVPAAEKSSEQGTGAAEKTADLTMLYRVRAAAAPSAITVFRTAMENEISPGQEWHWAIVEAKGYPPQSEARASAMPASH